MLRLRPCTFGELAFVITTLVSLALPGCGGGTPAAPTTPVLTGLAIAGASVPIVPMPITAQPSQYVVATIAAPYPADLKIKLDGTDLERVVSDPGRERTLADQGLGFFAVDNVDPNPNPAVWKVRISTKPVNQCSLVPFVAEIRHVVSGQESAPLTVPFITVNNFKLIGTSGRIVALEQPKCPQFDEFKLERSSPGGAFATVATLPSNVGGFHRDTGLTPSTPFVYRLTLVRVLPAAAGTPPTKIDLGSPPTVTAATTALKTGTEQVSVSQADPTGDRHHWSVTTFDPLATGGIALALGAVITRVQNDGDRTIVVTFKDTSGAQVSAIQIGAHSSVTAPFAGMLFAGTWDPIRTTGSAVGLPTVWPLSVSWMEP